MAGLLVSLVACKMLDGDDKGEKAEGSESSGESASGGDSVGVPECDEYITKYQKCIEDKVPDAAKEQMKKSFETMRTSWKQAASTEAGKAGLAQGCKTAMESAKTAMKAYGCEF